MDKIQREPAPLTPQQIVGSAEFVMRQQAIVWPNKTYAQLQDPHYVRHALVHKQPFPALMTTPRVQMIVPRGLSVIVKDPVEKVITSHVLGRLNA
jgi:hypothetical protein